VGEQRAQLVALIRELLDEGDEAFDDELRGDTSLIRSGLLDSLAILRLAEWIDERVAQPIDLNTTDIGGEWDTIDSLLDYVRRHA
jgi:aryl carrier-like protein